MSAVSERCLRAEPSTSNRPQGPCGAPGCAAALATVRALPHYRRPEASMQRRCLRTGSAAAARIPSFPPAETSAPPDLDRGRFVARCAIAASLAEVIAAHVGLSHPVWAPISALVVTQESVAETLAAGCGRIVGSVPQIETHRENSDSGHLCRNHSESRLEARRTAEDNGITSRLKLRKR
jgi:Fusaric acid resistance protein family